MDAHTPRDEDDLSAVERRLTGWRPGGAGLDADAMLFAAGLATGRRGRLFGLAVSGLLAVLAAGLGAWALTERAERQALASRLRDRTAHPKAPPKTDVPAGPASSYEPSEGDYLSMRRRMEQDPNGWPAARQPAGRPALGPPPPQPAILTARQRDGLLEQ
jgi:hypothetical protein